MPHSKNQAADDARLLPQERIVDALLRALALQQPDLMNTLRAILTDSELTHAGKPGEDETVHQQIQSRIEQASQFAQAHERDQAR